MHKMIFISSVIAVVIAGFSIAAAQAWKLPADRGTVGKDEIADGKDYPETTSYTQKIEFIDFTSYGKKFTQVVVRLDPKQPRTRNGKKLVVVGTEPGSEYGMDFWKRWRGKRERPSGWPKEGLRSLRSRGSVDGTFSPPVGDSHIEG